MPQRSVATNYTFEQQRSEINLLAADFWSHKTAVDGAASTYLKHDGSNDFTGGTLAVPNAFTINANSGAGTLTISGNLNVTGTTTTVNTTNLEVTDKNILIAKGSTSDANSDGAGITIDSGTDITWNFVNAKDAWVSSIGVEATSFLKGPYGQFTGSGTPTTGYGVEVNAPDENTGQIISYHRGNSAYKELRIKGSSVGVYTGTTNALEASFNSTGLSVEGLTTAKSGLVVGSANETKAQDGVIIERNSSAGIAHITAGRSGGNYSGFEFYVAGASGVTKRLSLDYQGNQNFYKEDGTTSQFYIKHDGKVGIGVTSLTAQLTIDGASQAMASEGTLKIQAPAEGEDVGGGITFGNSVARRAAIVGKQEGAGTNLNGYLAFGTRDTSGDITERLRITSNGDIRQEWNDGNFFGSYYDADYYMGLTYGATARTLYIDNRSNDTRADIVFRTKLGQSTPEERLRISSSGYMQLKNDPGSTFALLRNTAVADSTSLLGSIDFGTADWDSSTAQIASYQDGAKDKGSLRFYTQAAVGSGIQERLRIQSDGKILIAKGTPDTTTSQIQIGNGTTGYSWDNGDVPQVLIAGVNNESPTSGSLNIALRVEDENANNMFQIHNRGGGNNDIGEVYMGGRVNIGTINQTQGQLGILNTNDFDSASVSTNTDNIWLISDATSGDGVYGASIGFSRVQYADRRAAAITTVQEGTDEDRVGLSFFTHASADAAAAVKESLRVGHEGVLTSKLSSGSMYSQHLLEITTSATPTQCKIITSIPWTGDSSHAHSVRIAGFRYGGQDTVDLQICWHVYNNSFYNRIATSTGSWAPTITLAVENGYVVIHLTNPGYWPKFYVESLYHPYGSLKQANNWSWTDAAVSGDAGLPVETVPYKSHFGNDTSISRESNGETNMYIAGSNPTLGARLILKNNDNTANSYNDLSFCDAGGQSTSIVRGINHNDASNEGYLEFYCRPNGGLPTKWMDITATGELRTFVGTGKESHNYCKYFQWGGYAQCSATWSVSIPNLTQGNIYRVMAYHSHHSMSYGSYIEGVYGAYSNHSGLQIDTDYRNESSGAGGSWDVTRGGTNGDPVVITHTGGTYNGYGHWFIWVLSGTT